MSVAPMDNPPPAMPYQNPVLPAIAKDGAVGSLDVLQDHRKVILQQKMDLLEAMTALDMPNKYVLTTMDDQPMMTIEEVPTGDPRRHRELDVIARNTGGQKLFHITRPNKPCSLCAFCCAFMGPCKYEGDVCLYDQNDKHLGHLTQKVSFASARLVVVEKGDDVIYTIEGENACCAPTKTYKIKNKKGDKEGEIEKQGMGLGTGQNRWEIKFPKDATPNDKALIIGLAVLIDYRFHFNAIAGARHRRR